MSFSHPVKIIADTCYWYYPKEFTIRGSIKFRQKVCQKYLYLLADDSCQFNKVVFPNGIGVTAQMNVYFFDTNVTNADIEVKITKQIASKSGKLKSFIAGRIFNKNNTICTYNGLFIESHLISNPIQKGIQPFIIKRTTFTDPNLTVNDFYTKTNTIHWKNGFGPQNHVHGGISVFPLFDTHINKIMVEYKKPIPLPSFSNLFTNKNYFAIKNLDDDVQVLGKIE